MDSELNNKLYLKYEYEINSVANFLSLNYRVPGLDRDDIKQEIKLHCWEFVHRYDPSKNDYPLGYFKKVGVYHAINLITIATAKKRYRSNTCSINDVGDIKSHNKQPEIEEEIEFKYLLKGVDPKEILSDYEYETLMKYINNEGYSSKNKKQDNARIRFLSKIRAKIKVIEKRKKWLKIE